MEDRLDNIFPKLKGGLEIMKRRGDNLHEKYRRAVEIDAFLRKGFKDTKLTKLYGDGSWRELNLTLIDDDKELINFMSDYFERKIDQLIDELEQEVGINDGTQ